MLYLVRKIAWSPLVLNLGPNLPDHQSIHQIFPTFKNALFDILSRDKARNGHYQLIIPRY